MKFWFDDMNILTADDVARAIVASCRETGADPILVASGGLDAPGDADKKIAHARRYAVIAIMTAFPKTPKMPLARMCGVRSENTQRYYVLAAEKEYKGGRLIWWRSDAFDRIVDFVHGDQLAKHEAGKPVPTVREPPPDIVIAVKPSPPARGILSVARPANDEPWEQDALSRRAGEKSKLRDLLADAVANTAKMMPKEN